MKERIEEKLGCSIEEYFKKRLELFDKYEGLEIEIPNPLVGLEWEELDFIDNYIRHMDIAS